MALDLDESSCRHDGLPLPVHRAPLLRARVGDYRQTGRMKPSQRYFRDSNLMMDFRNAYVELTNNA